MFDDTLLANLPVNEKLRLVTALWDQISRSAESMPVADSILDDADQRIKEMMDNPDASQTEGEMWSRADELR